ncbi:MAG: PrsW family intramembrane metalloprotease [Eubacterium sp.]|nr:PrsW family intramembrane metalloprotease [Eubacterium sp.]
MIYSENILICMAIPLVLSLFFTQGDVRRFMFNFIIGMVVCLLGAYISGFIDVITGNGVEETAIFISPVVEETVKFLPLLFYFYMFIPTDKELFNAAVGLGVGFSMFENVCSMISAGTESLVFLLIRGLAVGVMHIVSVMALILGLIIAKKFKALQISSMIGALSVSMLFHGMYNLLVSEPGIASHIGYMMPLLTALIILLAYKRLQ